MKKLPVIAFTRFLFQFENGNVFIRFIKINKTFIADMFPSIGFYRV